MIRFLLLPGLLLLGPTVRADEPAPQPWRGFAKRQVERFQHLEAVEMIRAIATGSQMGPGEGWFHPSQSRYDWKWLAARHEIDAKGTIAKKDFRGPAELFDRLDRNHDGVLSAEDFDWSDSSPHLRGTNMAGQWFRMIDTNANGRISREEWDAFFTKAARNKDHLTPDDLQQALGLLAPSKAPANPSAAGMPSPWLLIGGVFSGELGSICEGPKLGQKAPDFTLKTQQGDQTIRLSDRLGKKPVVLIFGSFT